MTQEDIYKLVTQVDDDTRIAVMDKAKADGLIAYDRQECWYRPTSEVGTPLDADLYHRYFPRMLEAERFELLNRIEAFRRGDERPTTEYP